MNDLVNAVLFLFSALLTSDAAIIGFGAIFIIYKLQSLDALFQTSLFICNSSPDEKDHKAAVSLAIETDHDEKMKILQAMKGSRYYHQLKSISEIPDDRIMIRDSLFKPLIFTGLHLIVSAVLIVIAPHLVSQESCVRAYSASGLVIVAFAFLLFYLAKFAQKKIV